MNTAMKTEKVRVPSSKGSLAVVIHYPKKKTGKLAILCPGYLDSKDYGHLKSLAEALSKEGYTAVRFDPTGVWESDGTIADYTTTHYLEDVKNVIEYMLQQGDYGHILVGGHSRGGAVAISYAVRDPRVSVVLAIMPSSKFTTTMGQRHKNWQETGVSTSYRDLPGGGGERREFRVPYSYAVDKDRYDAGEDVKKIRVPILFIAGGEDDKCPPERVREIFERANEPKKFILMPGVGHDYRLNEDWVKLVDKGVMGWLQSLAA